MIAEIETDKATMEVEAVDEGTLAKIVVAEGTTDVPVNQLIAVLAGEGEDVKSGASGAAKGGVAARQPRACCRRSRPRCTGSSSYLRLHAATSASVAAATPSGGAR